MTRKAATVTQSYWDAKLRRRRSREVRQFVRSKLGPRQGRRTEAEALFRRSA